MAKKKTGGASAGTLTLRLRKSLIGASPRQRAVVRGLGLRRRLNVVERPDTPEVRGMLAKVEHLVELVVDGDEAGRRNR